MKPKPRFVPSLATFTAVAAALTFSTSSRFADARSPLLSSFATPVPLSVGHCPPYCSPPCPPTCATSPPRTPTPAPTLAPTPTPSPVPTPSASQLQQLQQLVVSNTPNKPVSIMYLVTFQSYVLVGVDANDTGIEQLWQFNASNQRWIGVAKVGGAFTVEDMVAFGVPMTTAQQLWNLAEAAP